MYLTDLIAHELRRRGHDPETWAGERHGVTVQTLAGMLTGRLPAVPAVLLDLSETTGITPSCAQAA